MEESKDKNEAALVAATATRSKGWLNRTVAGAGITSALGTVNGTAKFISSATVGVVWTAVSPTLGFGLAALLMTAGTLALLHVGNE